MKRRMLRSLINKFGMKEEKKEGVKKIYSQLINSVYLFGGGSLGSVFIFLPLQHFTKNNVLAASISFVISMFIGYYFTHKKKKYKGFFIYGFFLQAVIMLYLTVLSSLIGDSYPENLYLILCLPGYFIANNLMEKVTALDAIKYLKDLKEKFIK